MAQVLLLLVVALTVGAVVFGVMVLVSGGDPGLREVEPDGRGVPLPASRPLIEQDVTKATFDLALRGYRMEQVDKALKRVAYDIGYKDELVSVLTAEVEALRDGRVEDADALRAARLAALGEGAVPGEADDKPENSPIRSGGLIDLGDLERSTESAPAEAVEPTDDEMPDGPFAPWPPAKAAKADDEADHPTDAQEQADAKPSAEDESDTDRVVSRG
ncbi:DivIVA domain-containing protein [Hamadaea tsunoensis]|uniref:DivIVA domain-containing protein n=1 Tax=Hamadaea tsunoensis TaxID=53368 RepID=UPI0007E8BB3B|nr:DivIVA domain-containing protein [Hamadaea tsunoensis]